MFAWLGLALLIDGIDGTLARIGKVEERLPRFSGERLDQVIDYITYVFIPVLALTQRGAFDRASAGLALAIAILLSSLFHFSDLGNKSEDHCFVGFPAIWNIVAFYLFALALPFWAAALVIVACVAADVRADALGAPDAGGGLLANTAAGVRPVGCGGRVDHLARISCACRGPGRSHRCRALWRRPVADLAVGETDAGAGIGLAPKQFHLGTRAAEKIPAPQSFAGNEYQQSAFLRYHLRRSPRIGAWGDV